MNNETPLNDLDLAHEFWLYRRNAVRAGFAITPEQQERALTDKNPDVRWAAIRAGCAITPEQQERALTDKNPDVRWAAIRAGCATTPKQKERALNDKNSGVRNAAIRAGCATTPKQKERAFTDEHPEVRNAAIQAGCATTLEEKERALADSDWEVRFAAIEAGCATTPEQKERALNDEDDEVRALAVQRYRSVNSMETTDRERLRHLERMLLVIPCEDRRTFEGVLEIRDSGLLAEEWVLQFNSRHSSALNVNASHWVRKNKYPGSLTVGNPVAEGAPWRVLVTYVPANWELLDYYISEGSSATSALVAAIEAFPADARNGFE